MGRSKSLGDGAVLAVMSDLHQRRWNVFIPIGENSPVDLVGLDPIGRACRIQIRYSATRTNSGKPILKLANVTYKAGGGYRRYTLDRSKIDLFALLSEDGKLYYIASVSIPTKKTSEIVVQAEAGRLPDW